MIHHNFARGFAALIKGFAAVIGFTAAAVLILPLAGPVLDHHFAERQPGHLHFGFPHEHRHAFESSHHLHPPNNPPPDNQATAPIALYKSDGGIAATLATSPADVDAAPTRQFQPTSILTLPDHPANAAIQHIPAPPHKPPTCLL